MATSRSEVKTSKMTSQRFLGHNLKSASRYIARELEIAGLSPQSVMKNNEDGGSNEYRPE